MPTESIKNILQLLSYGFYSIGSRSDNEVNLMVANWVTQVSFEPRRIAIGLQKSAFSHKLVSQGMVLSLNLFRAEDVESIKPYTKSSAKNPEKMADANYSIAPLTGCPIPEGSAAYLECQVIEIIDFGGDHDLVIAEPIGGQVIKPSQVGDILSLPDIGWSYAG